MAWAQVQKDKSQFSFQGERQPPALLPLVLAGREVRLEAGVARLSSCGAKQGRRPLLCRRGQRKKLVVLRLQPRRPDPPASGCPLLSTSPPAGEAEGSYFHSSKWVSSVACNVQTIGRDVLYTPRIETRLKTGRRNKVAVGALFSRLGEDYSHPFNVSAEGKAPGLAAAGSSGRTAHRAGFHQTGRSTEQPDPTAHDAWLARFQPSNQHSPASHLPLWSLSRAAPWRTA